MQAVISVKHEPEQSQVHTKRHIPKMEYLSSAAVPTGQQGE